MIALDEYIETLNDEKLSALFTRFAELSHDAVNARRAQVTWVAGEGSIIEVED